MLGDQNKYFKAEHDILQTLNKWFFGQTRS